MRFQWYYCHGKLNFRVVKNVCLNRKWNTNFFLWKMKIFLIKIFWKVFMSSFHKNFRFISFLIDYFEFGSDLTTLALGCVSGLKCIAATKHHVGVRTDLKWLPRELLLHSCHFENMISLPPTCMIKFFLQKFARNDTELWYVTIWMWQRSSSSLQWIQPWFLILHQSRLTFESFWNFTFWIVKFACKFHF